LRAVFSFAISVAPRNAQSAVEPPVKTGHQQRKLFVHGYIIEGIMKDTKTNNSSIRDLVFLMLVMFGTSFLSPSAGAQELKKVRIGYPAFSLTFLTFFVAKDAGIYKKHGLDVDMIQMAGAVQTSALVEGEIDYLTGITSPLVAAARGRPFKGIVVTHGRALFWLFGNPEIRRAEDLIGKTVAVDRLATLQDIVARDLVKKKGVNPEQVTFIQTGSVSNS